MRSTGTPSLRLGLLGRLCVLSVGELGGLIAEVLKETCKPSCASLGLGNVIVDEAPDLVSLSFCRSAYEPFVLRERWRFGVFVPS